MSTELSRDEIRSYLQGYQLSPLVRTGIQTGIFDALAGGADERGTRILLNALGALGLVLVDDGR